MAMPHDVLAQCTPAVLQSSAARECCGLPGTAVTPQPPAEASQPPELAPSAGAGGRKSKVDAVLGLQHLWHHGPNWEPDPVPHSCLCLLCGALGSARRPRLAFQGVQTARGEQRHRRTHVTAAGGACGGCCRGMSSEALSSLPRYRPGCFAGTTSMRLSTRGWVPTMRTTAEA